MTNEMISEIISLVDSAKNVYVSSVDENGYPNTKAMMSLYREGLDQHYFSTNVSSKRVAQFKANPKACIYYSDETSYRGLMLVGTMEVCTDAYHRELLWNDDSIKYYPKGVTDDDYCVYKFTAEHGRYYPGLSKTFDVKELRVAELNIILKKFAESGWDVIDAPSKAWLEGKENLEELLAAVKKADEECGSCGCEFDKLYKIALSYLERM